MTLFRAISVCACLVIGGHSPAISEGLDLPGGLLLGSRFSEVERFFRSQGEKLKQTDFSSNAWSVERLGLTFYFCNQSLTGMDQYLEGELRGFVDTVRDLKLEYGEPETEVFVLAPHSQFEMHGVQSSFKTSQGATVTVQLYTRDNSNTLWKRTSDGSDCQTE